MERTTRRFADTLDNKQLWKAKGLPLTLIAYWHYGPAGDHVGLWTDELMRIGEGGQEWPPVTRFVDENWDQAERDGVVSYLGQGLTAWAMGGHSVCRFCGESNGCAERTDGVYLWPEGLAHYIRDHNVRLPGSVVCHMLTRPADLEPRETDDWWEKFNDDEGLYVGGVMPAQWWTARI